MPIPDISRRDIPVGPLRDMFEITIVGGGDDYELQSGFVCQLRSSSNNVMVRTLEGQTDIEMSNANLPYTMGIGTHPVLLRAVRAHATGAIGITVGRL